MKSSDNSLKVKYRRLFEDEGRLIFLQPWWLDAIAGTGWDVALDIRGDQIFGGWVYCIRYKFGIPYVCNAPLSPYQGIFYRYPSDLGAHSRISFENRVLSNLLSKLPNTVYLHQTLESTLKNLLPLIWANFSTQFRYTYVLNDISDINGLWENMQPQARRVIRKLETSREIDVTECDNPQVVYDVHAESMAYRGKAPQFSFNTFKRLDDELRGRNLRKIWIGKNELGQIVGGVYIVWYKDIAYYLLGGVNRASSSQNTTIFLLWQAIKNISGKVKSFDFEGSMIPGVERVFRSFGAEQRVYPEIKRYKFPVNLLKIWK